MKRLAESLTGIASPSWLRAVLSEQPQVQQPQAANSSDLQPSPNLPPEDEEVPEQGPAQEAPPADQAGDSPTQPDWPPVGGTQADPADMPEEPTRPFHNDGLDKLNVDGSSKPSPTRYRQPGPGDQKAIQRFLKQNPSATDDELHTFLRSLGIDPQEGEKVVMKLARQKAESVVPSQARALIGLFIAERDNDLQQQVDELPAPLIGHAAAESRECADRQVNKPWRTPDGPKKFAVCGKEGGDTKLVRFGDPKLEIKRDNPERRMNFRARHGCDQPGPKTKAKYWACKTWERKKTVSDVVESIIGLFLERRDRIPGGVGDKLSEKDVDPEQLRMGIDVELEHTKSNEIAKEIALDHLKEDPAYYTKLKKVHKESDESLRRAERSRHGGDEEAALAFHAQLRRHGPEAVKDHFQQLSSKLIQAHQAHRDAADRYNTYVRLPVSERDPNNNVTDALMRTALAFDAAHSQFLSEVDRYGKVSGQALHPALHLHRGDTPIKAHMHVLGHLHGVTRPPEVEQTQKATHVSFTQQQDTQMPFGFAGVDQLANSIRHHYKNAKPDITKASSTAFLHVRLPAETPPLRRVKESDVSSAQIITDDAPEPPGVAGEDDEVDSKLATLLRNIGLPIIRHENTEHKKRVTCGVFLPLPYDLARQFPRMLGGKNADDSPPHVTLLYVGDISPTEYTDMIDVVQRVIASYQPFFVDMCGADVFDDQKDYDTLYASVTSRTFRALGSVVYPTINVLHADLRKAVEAAGIKVEHTYGKKDGHGSHAERFVPHVTIARVPKNEQCLVRPPSGSWFALDVECWGYERVQLQLGKIVINQPVYRGQR